MQERQVRNMNVTEGRQVTRRTCSGYGRRGILRISSLVPYLRAFLLVKVPPDLDEVGHRSRVHAQQAVSVPM